MKSSARPARSTVSRERIRWTTPGRGALISTAPVTRSGRVRRIRPAITPPIECPTSCHGGGQISVSQSTSFADMCSRSSPTSESRTGDSVGAMTVPTADNDGMIGPKIDPSLPTPWRNSSDRSVAEDALVEKTGEPSAGCGERVSERDHVGSRTAPYRGAVLRSARDMGSVQPATVRDHTECIAIGSIASLRRRAGEPSATGPGTDPAGLGWKKAATASS